MDEELRVCEGKWAERNNRPNHQALRESPYPGRENRCIGKDEADDARASCGYHVGEAEGRDILTIEELSEGREFYPIQEAFMQYGAAQCGYCSPGMILSTKALLAENPCPTEQEVRVTISGNLCRCTGYKKIVEAILSLSRNSKKFEAGKAMY